MRITNKEMIQSYIVTTARYDFNLYEKRIIYKLIEMCQCALEGQKLNKDFRINNMLFDDLKEVEMPISAFLKDEKDENYTLAKKALLSLNNKVMQYEDSEVWKVIRIIEMPKLIKKGYVKFVLQKEIYDALLNFSKGFRRLEIDTAMQFESVYSMRFYELLSGKTEPITYSINDLKIMFQLENKYKETKDFIRRIIDTAQRELAEKSPFSFTYKKMTLKKRIIALTFFPYFINANVNEDIEAKQLQKQVSLRWDLDKMVIDYLKQNYFFDDNAIRVNLETLKEGCKTLDIMNFLSKKKRKASDSPNPIGYIIKAIKGETAKIKSGGVIGYQEVKQKGKNRNEKEDFSIGAIFGKMKGNNYGETIK